MNADRKQGKRPTITDEEALAFHQQVHHRFLGADEPGGEFQVLQPREADLEYDAEHLGDSFYIVTNLGARNFRLMKAPVSKPLKENWTEVIAHREEVLLQGIELFDGYMAISERQDGLTRLRIIKLADRSEHYIDFGEETYSARIGENMEMDSGLLRFEYSSLTTPNSTYEYDMETREKRLVKREKVLGGFDPAGSVSIINMNTRTATTVGFAGVPTAGTAIRLPGMDYEPEYIAINAAGTQAFVTLQEANAIGIMDLGTQQFTSVVGLGTKDFSLPGNEIDPSHKDYVSGSSGPTLVELRSANVQGFYQPDSIAAYDVGGQTYLVMANEGDTREDDGDKARLKDSVGVSGPADLKQLNISTTDSTTGDLYTFGGRSFSIRDASGNLVFDSGNQLDTEAIARGIYDDNRSDDKGVEPEGVELMEIGGRTLAFIGLERTTKGAVAIYDITDPANASFIDMIVTDGDVAPEGMKAFCDLPMLKGQERVVLRNTWFGPRGGRAHGCGRQRQSGEGNRPRLRRRSRPGGEGDAHHVGGAPGDDADLHPGGVEHLHAVAVAGVERLVLLAIVADEEAAVGEHAVDVEDDQFDLCRFCQNVLHGGLIGLSG